MHYCEHCCRIFQQDRCPFCGSKKARPPRPEDFCFLTEQKQIWTGLLEDVLKQRNMAYLAQPVLGAALAFSVGQGLERYRIYVPFACLEEAKELLEEVLPGKAD